MQISEFFISKNNSLIPKMDSSSTDLNTPVGLNSFFANGFTNKEKRVSYCSFCQRSNNCTDWEFLKEFFLCEQNSALQIQNLKTELAKARITISVFKDQYFKTEATLLKCHKELENAKWTKFEKLKQFEDQLGQVKKGIFDDRVELKLHFQDLKWENHDKQERINKLECALGLQKLQQCEDGGNRVGEISLVTKIELGSITSF